MLYKSALMTAASGSVKGLTASHNRAGSYFRGRTIPVNTNTAHQQSVRSALTTVVASWSGDLDDDQRQAWSDYGAAVGTTTALGDPISMSGISAYVQANVPRLQVGYPLALDGPTVFSLPEFGDVTGLAASAAAQGITFVYDDTKGWADQDDSGLIVQISRPQNNTINFFNGPYRFAATIDGSSTSPPSSPAAIPVPFPIVVGQKVFVRIRLTLASGRLSGVFRGGVLVTT